MSGLFPHNWLPHEIHLVNPLNRQPHFPGTWAAPDETSRSQPCITFTICNEFQISWRIKKKKKIYLKSSAKSERLNIITKNTNPVLTYLRLWPEKRRITTADVVFYWEHFLGWKYKATGLQTQKHATTEIHFCTRKIGWLNYFNSVKLLIFLKLCFRRVVPRNNRGQIKCCRIRTRGIWGKYGTEEQHLFSCL